MNIDVNYLAESLATLCGIPTRIYKDNKEIKYFGTIKFKTDPIILDINKILDIKDNLSYYINDYFFYYGIINYNKNYKLIIGPSREIKIDEYSLNNYALVLGIKNDEIHYFKNNMNLIIPMPLTSLMQSLASLNYILNNEKINISDLMISSTNDTESLYDNGTPNDIHNSYLLEEKIKKMVFDGDIDSFIEFTKQSQSIRDPIYSTNYLRNIKDNFIVASTLLSRVAIEAGLDVNNILNLNELYIRECEILNNPNEILNLKYKMVTDYINKVKQIKNCNPFIQKINNYIINNLSKSIEINDLTKYLNISKSTLCNKIKKITNKSVNYYILEYKINYSKELIKKNISLSAISNNLGFSSQQHFSNVFKKFFGMTPLQYKNN